MSDPTSEKTDSGSSEFLLSEVGGSEFSIKSNSSENAPSGKPRPCKFSFTSSSRNFGGDSDDEEESLPTPSSATSMQPSLRHRPSTRTEAEPVDNLSRSPPSYDEIHPPIHQVTNTRSNWRRNNLLRRRNLLVFAIVSMVLSTAAVVLLGILLLREKGFQDSIPSEVFKVCVPEVYVDANLKLAHEGNSLCASSNDEVSSLFDHVIAQINRVKNKTVVDAAGQSIGELGAQDPEKGHPNAFCNLSFNGECGLCDAPDSSTFMKLKGCKIDVISGTRLKINSTGYFYVYSKINVTLASKEGSNCQNFRHYVLRHHPNHPQDSGILSSSLQTWCENSTSDTSSFTGGIFKLRKEDDLSVHICVESNGTEAKFNSTTDGKEPSYLGYFSLS